MRTMTALPRRQLGAIRRAGSFLSVSRAFVSSRVPERAPEDRGWPGLAGWMKAQIRAKTRNQGHDWIVFRRPDKKKGTRSLARLVAGDARCPSERAFCFSLSDVRYERKGNCTALAHGPVQVCIGLRKSNLRSLHRTGTNKTKEQIAWCCICVWFGTRFLLERKKMSQIALVLAAFACEQG
jgi:hypothetical protein